MFIYVDIHNNIFYHSDELAASNDEVIFGEDILIRKSASTYTTIEVDNNLKDKLKYFTEFKYAWDPDAEDIVYKIPEDEIKDKKEDLRAQRAPLLDKSDEDSLALWADRWDAQDTATKDAWIAYRQALRDITDAEDLDAVDWPTYPLDLGGSLNPIPEDSA